MPAISEFLKKAHEALNSFRGINNTFIGKDGDVVYSKNNVCIHDVFKKGADGSIQHIPGYLTLQCQSDEVLGVTLILQWLPNTTLEKNPESIRSVSPRNKNTDPGNEPSKLRSPDEQHMTSVQSDDDDDRSDGDNDKTQTSSLSDECSPVSDSDINVEMNGDMITVTSMNQRPISLVAQGPQITNRSTAVGVPSINVIPNTPVNTFGINEKDADDDSATTSGADELSDRDDEQTAESSSSDDPDNERMSRLNKAASPEASKTNILQQYRDESEILCKITPEQFARAHNLILENDMQTDSDGCVSVSTGSAIFHQKPPSASLFSVNLGKMRSMRLFFTADDSTSGQFVIATWDSHYKILHFHHGGLDKLAQLLEQWSVIKTKIVADGSSSPVRDRQFLICQPEVSKTELDPEEGLYERVSWDFWKSYKNQDGRIDDSFTVRKAIYFATMDPALRREAWPFLLRVYPWTSTLDQRETMRNDFFIEYQNIRKRRMKHAFSAGKMSWMSVESTITKDVIRTDRRKPYFAGDNNPNIETMKNILLNYAADHPEISYIQGMSDLLAPLLSTIRDESDAYWCFVGLMQQTLFASVPTGEMNVMNMNLEYLRELLKLFAPSFFTHLANLGQDALQLMFVHRWILLCYKREFCEIDALHIWEACWARYRTSYFHLFVAVAIISVYGEDVIEQRLPNDEILLYFSSLAMHMDGTVVLKKARGLLYEFHRLEKLPCTLAALCESDTEQWDTNIQQRIYECTKIHGENEPCPFAESV